MNLLSKISPIAFSIGDFEIRWYAICILIGALVTYFVSNAQLKKLGYPDLADTLFITAFPAGIIGARIWWCIADSGSPWHNGNFWGFITEIRDGGLAIQGGVVFGALTGVLVLLLVKKMKFKEILKIADCIVPNILIAQVCGRWGNFFNQEVYGSCVDPAKLSWLPDFIVNQMMGGGGIYCSSSLAAQPLFLYEGVLNLIGWILLTFVLRKLLSNKLYGGELSTGYLIWYGAVRACLEPLRNASFIMDGLGGLPVSVITSIVFVIAGIGCLIAIRLINRKKKND